MIPQGFIDDLLARLDIVEVIDHRVKLRKTGKNYAACCPFHDEKTPSFTVSPDKQFYYCFGCGASGNAVGFLMAYERSSFVESVENLARLAGVEVPRETNQQDLAEQKRRSQLYSLAEAASAYFQQQLRQHKQRRPAVDYLKSRGLNLKMLERYELGYAPPGWNNVLDHLGGDAEKQKQLADVGLVIFNQDRDSWYDRFRHRIMFPIKDSRGRTIGFGGRVLGNDKPKYLNSPETAIFHKGKELYGLYEARQANRELEHLIVVEGYMDVIALAQFEISNAVATLGTACGEDHLKLCFKYTSEVVFCFDGDHAGRTAAKRALLNSLSSMTDGRQIKFLFLPEGQDPDTLVRRIGKERFDEQLKMSLPLEEFLFATAAENLDISTMEGRARFSKTAAPLLNQLPKGVYRELMFDQLAKRTGLSREMLNELTAGDITIELPSAEKRAAVDRSAAPSTKSDTTSVDVIDDGSEDLSSDAHEYFGNTSDSSIPPYDLDDDEIPADDYLDYEQAHFQQEHPGTAGVRKIPTTTFYAVRTATILLFNQPDLIEQTDVQLDDLTENDEPELLRLKALMDYLRTTSGKKSKHAILGFWGGKFGTDEPELLATLTQQHQKIRGGHEHQKHYDAANELKDALNRICRAREKDALKHELKKLQNRDITELSQEEKQRLLELIQLFR